MKALKNLIRLQQWQLDQSRLALALAEEKRAEIAARLDELDREAVSERQAATQSDPALFAFPGFAGRLKQKRQAVEEELTEATGAVEQARAQVAVEFQEEKKLQQALDAEIARRQAETARREQIQLDEIAATGHQRRQSGG